MFAPMLLNKQVSEYGIFSIICVIIIPLLLIIIGLLFKKRTLPRINHFIGYRTSLSMKNDETWKVANRTLGKIWTIVGLISLPLSLIAIVPFLNKPENTLGTAIAIITLIQTIMIVSTIIPIEIKLRKTFDDKGNRKQ